MIIEEAAPKVTETLRAASFWLESATEKLNKFLAKDMMNKLSVKPLLPKHRALKHIS